MAHGPVTQYILRMATSVRPSRQPPTTGVGVPTIWVDGMWYDRETATVSVYDHSLLYGDGVFEGIRVYGGKIFRLREHLERLYDSAKAHLSGELGLNNVTRDRGPRCASA